ncbi:hypothetical protein OSB04_002755 [Centaurea solstitialis]|uniref:Uncharacterized protein n=1 Tax=Centaurea solstitialis TaxID=347529 RepID=A0AA38TTY4_9ASTR|nr:hypothetical protein OSB04_002755 [Centaurea solstitialis]
MMIGNLDEEGVEEEDLVEDKEDVEESQIKVIRVDWGIPTIDRFKDGVAGSVNAKDTINEILMFTN